MTATGKRRAFGQHFLVDDKVCSGIVRAFVQELKNNGCATALEIGPGKGALTSLLLDQAKVPVIICEKDPKLARKWQDATRDRPDSQVHLADFLELPREHWVGRPPVGVLSNLPYSSGTAILQLLAREREAIVCMVLMFQREVARRVRAEPDSREWGSLSLWVQNFWEVTHLMEVPPTAFAPPPKVYSEVVILRRRAEPLVPMDADQEVLWEKLLKTCFAHRRKMLRSSLPKDGPWLPALERAGIDPTLRAEALSWDAWKRFFQAL